MAFQNPGQVDARHGTYHETHGDQFTIMGPIILNFPGNPSHDSYMPVDGNRSTSSPVLASIRTTGLVSPRFSEPSSDLLAPLKGRPPTLPEIQTAISPERDRGGALRVSCYPQMEHSHTFSTYVYSTTAHSAVSTQRLSQFKAENGSIKAATLEGLIEHLITDPPRKRIGFTPIACFNNHQLIFRSWCGF